MTWFGKLSAWAALAVGVLYAVNAYFQFATGVDWWVFAATSLALIAGGYRTLRKMSGGLRLLAGAWGFAAGLQVFPLMAARLSDALADPGGVAFALIALAGLALTVLHKEQK